MFRTAVSTIGPRLAGYRELRDQQTICAVVKLLDELHHRCRNIRGRLAIASLALSVVLQTLVVNCDYLGGSRGAYILRPATVDIAGLSLS